ncbi:hypothetical protein BD560DRAFT_452903 [Blakeslea trispora]|nr:hypothetical protein BD560DRAFT_452903 [Blakeslea trispora]
MEEAISQLQDLGVTRGQAKQALARYNNDVALAADYIFSGANLSDEEIEVHRITIYRLFSTVRQKEAAVHQTSYDVSKWGIVPFTPDEKPSQPLSLTWWKDPEDPTERLASPHIPIGLRPPSYHFAYAPIIIQALFHVTAFQQAVLSFRPLPYTWKSPKNYWKGFGEPVPNYRMHPKQSTSSHSPKEAQLIALDSPDSLPIDQLTLTETTVDQVEEEQELEKMSVSMQALAELQRLFAFLGNTQRQYGSVSHFVRALNAKEEADAWGNNEKSFEAFLDMLILCLVQVDEQSEKAIEMDYKPIFRK